MQALRSWSSKADSARCLGNEQSEVHMDFAFLDREDNPQRTVPVLVVKYRTSKVVRSAPVPQKTTGTEIAKKGDCEKLGAGTET